MRQTDKMAVTTSVAGVLLVIVSVFMPPGIGRFTAPMSIVLILIAVFSYCVYGDEENV